MPAGREVPTTALQDAAVAAWNLMRGIEWPAVPLMVQMFEIEDAEGFVRALCAIRDEQSDEE